VKPGAENAQFWGTTVSALAKYFTVASGDIVFDFKIKGDMASPSFYLGPVSKRALTAMAIDKISDVLAAAAKAQASGQESAGGNKQAEDIEAIADALKMFMKKK
jgi:hypothetical protein